jgi:hypothetical protein
MLAGDIAKRHLGVRRLLRREDPREGIDASVRHADGAKAQLAAEGRRRVLPGHGVEHARLA